MIWDIINYGMVIGFSVQVCGWVKRWEMKPITITKKHVVRTVVSVALVLSIWHVVTTVDWDSLGQTSNASFYGTCPQGHYPCSAGDTRRLWSEDEKTSAMYRWSGHTWEMVGK